MRGTAALSVVMFHIWELIVPDLAHNPMPHTFLVVDFFFALSGYVVGYAYDDRLELDVKSEIALSLWGFVKRRLGSAAALGKIDLTLALNAARGNGWTKIAVPSSCFRKAGVDMGAVTLPMVQTSSGRLAVSLYFVQAEPKAGQTSCPALETSKASVKVKTPTKAKPHVKTKAHFKSTAHTKPRVKGREQHAR